MARLSCEEIQKRIDELKKEEKDFLADIVGKIVPEDVLQKLRNYGFEVISIPRASKPLIRYTESEILQKIQELKKEKSELENAGKECIIEEKETYFPPVKKRKKYRARYSVPER